MRLIRSLHRQRASIAAVLLAFALLLARPPYTLIVELCLWAAVVAVAYELDRPAGGWLPFWTLAGVLGGVVLLLSYGGL